MTHPSVARTIAVAVAVLAPVAALGAWALHEWDDGHRSSASSVASATAPAPTHASSLLTKVRVRPDGKLLVRQWIRTAEPLTTMVVAAPVDPYLALGTVTATRLVVDAGGVPVKGPDEVTLDSAVLAFGATREVRLSYLLSGALQRTPGSARALARVTALDLFVGPGDMPATYVFSGAHILNLACSPAASAEPPVACGSQRGSEWVVRIAQPGAAPNRVMVQLDLAPSVAGSSSRY